MLTSRIYHFDAPKKRGARKPSVKLDNSWKAIYKQAYFDWQLAKLGQRDIDNIGYVQITSYPNVSTHKGFEQAVENYVKWKGGFAQNTPTMGTPRFKQSMVGGKMVKEMQGYNRAKGGKGKQDIDATINGINVKLELKCAGDEQKPEQKKYQERIEASKGFYIILRSMFELFQVVDMCNAGQSLKGVKFHDK